MKTKLLLLLLALVFNVSARADTPFDSNATERAIEQAYLCASEPQLAEAVKPLGVALAADSKNPSLLYERAFAHYAATVPSRATNNKDAMLAEFEQAIALLERVRGQPWEAEACALHANILGFLIGLKGGVSGMTLGPKSNQLMARASKVLPNSPRVLLFRGEALLNTPAAFGGDPIAGVKLLQQAVDLFGAMETNPTRATIPAAGPLWGHADALTWLGLGKKKAGDLAAARMAWQQALALEPDYAWVKFVLLPSLDPEAAK